MEHMLARQDRDLDVSLIVLNTNATSFVVPSWTLGQINIWIRIRNNLRLLGGNAQPTVFEVSVFRLFFFHGFFCCWRWSRCFILVFFILMSLKAFHQIINKNWFNAVEVISVASVAHVESLYHINCASFLILFFDFFFINTSNSWHNVPSSLFATSAQANAKTNNGEAQDHEHGPVSIKPDWSESSSIISGRGWHVSAATNIVDRHERR